MRHIPEAEVADGDGLCLLEGREVHGGQLRVVAADVSNGDGSEARGEWLKS